MKESDLQSWLLSDGISDDLTTLIRATVRTEIDNLVKDKDEHSPANLKLDWSNLLLAGSILARSELREHQDAALRIATGAVTFSPTQSVKDAGGVLLGKMANFRAVELATDRSLLGKDLESRLGTSLRLEAQRRQMDQAILVESSGQWIRVNDFQKRFWLGATNHDWMSASAPTASGKTFLVLQWIIDQMRASPAQISVYLAPTRALVSEIEKNLSDLLGDEKGIEVSSLPLRAKFDAAIDKKHKLILVFTQERLHLMANLLGDLRGIDLLIVDEAHKIGDHQRGVILQDAIERVVRANPKAKVAFISPATQNPEELLSDAPTESRTTAVDSDAPTVLQNIIFADQVPLKPKQWTLTLKRSETELNIGTLELKNKPSSLTKRLAFIAAASGERGGTLVYTNGAAEAEEVAELISQLLPAMDGPDDELTALADLARKGVHPQFALAPVVESGVAFHYGNMPSLIRLEIERLFRAGKIRFLVCTSTLIEGVNLSCRTIVVRGPKKGRGNPMEAHDFWNLAGRAGRWGDEFQGNIICINPNDTSAWPNGVPARARYPIRRESDAILDQADAFTEYLERRATSDLAGLEGREQFEQVGGYLLATHLRLGSIADAALAKRHSATALADIDRQLAVMAEKIEISADLAARHPGVSALGLQRLLEAFRAYKKDVENLLPAAVESEDGYDRFITVMRRINTYVYPAFLPDTLIPLHALIVVRWLKGFSLSAMIQKNIEWHKENNKPYKLASLIRDTMAIVEQTARFLAPKYFAAYVDVLKVHLHELGRSDLIDDDLDIGTQLEFGISTLTLLSLMELGLSRMSAVSLYEKMARDDMTKQDCLTWVLKRNARLEGLDIPSLIIREIREKLIPT